VFVIDPRVCHRYYSFILYFFIEILLLCQFFKYFVFSIFSGSNCILFHKTVRRALENTLFNSLFMTEIDRMSIAISDKRDYRKRYYF
jgi:hypothetical protein